MYYLLIKRYTPPINFKMVLNFYYINYQKNDETWNGLQCVAAKWFNIFTVDEIRSFRRIPVKSINCGWHFSYLGGKEMIIYKIKIFSHQEFNIKEIFTIKFSFFSNLFFCFFNCRFRKIHTMSYFKIFEGLSGINKLVAPLVITASPYSRIGKPLSLLII